MLVLPCAWVRGWLLRALVAVRGFGAEGRLIGFFGGKVVVGGAANARAVNKSCKQEQNQR